jgi:hypothetical protein
VDAVRAGQHIAGGISAVGEHVKNTPILSALRGCAS